MFHWIEKKLEISHGSNTSLQAMEGLRGVAVFFVFLVHYSSEIKPWLTESMQAVANFVNSFGHIGVDLFFVLSGYLIYGTIVNKEHFNPRSYVSRRVKRIYPTFLAVFSLYLILPFISGKTSLESFSSIGNLIYLLQNLLFLPGLFDIKPVVGVTWSLSYEVFYYIAMPLVIIILPIRKWSINTRIFFWAAISIFGFVFFYFINGPARLLMFLAGVLVFEISKKNFPLRVGGTFCLILSIILFGLKSLLDIPSIFMLLAIFVLFSYLCISAFSDGSTISKWLKFTPLRWLGNMSYSYYLIHDLFLSNSFKVFERLFPNSPPGDTLYFWLWIPMFIITLAAAFFLFVLIEHPLSLSRRGNANEKEAQVIKV